MEASKWIKCASAEFHFILLKFMSAQHPPSDPNGEIRQFVILDHRAEGTLPSGRLDLEWSGDSLTNSSDLPTQSGP